MDPWEVFYIGSTISIAPSLLRNLLYNTIPRLKQTWRSRCVMEAFTLVLTTVMLMTESVSARTAFVVSGTVYGLYFSWRMAMMESERALHHLQSMTSDRLRYLDTFRGDFMLSTCVAILAVDFDIFPGRFTKSETYGMSLMDLGPGGIVFSGGLVAGVARPSQRRHFWRSSRCLLLIGLLRLVLTRAANYQVMVNEYGQHWNFFFTLAGVSAFRSLLPLNQNRTVLLSVVFLALYQSVLSLGLNSVINSDNRQGHILLQNKEGICSLIGYCCLHDLGKFAAQRLISSAVPCIQRSCAPGLESKAESAKKWLSIWLMGMAIVISILFGLLHLSIQWIEPVSRRSSNLSYVLWICSYHLCQCLWKITLEVSELEKETHLSIAMNRNLFGLFLLANILTGMTNLVIDTGAHSDTFAVIYLSAYSAVVLFCAGVADGYAILLGPTSSFSDAFFLIRVYARSESDSQRKRERSMSGQLPTDSPFKNGPPPGVIVDIETNRSTPSTSSLAGAYQQDVVNKSFRGEDVESKIEEMRSMERVETVTNALGAQILAARVQFVDGQVGRELQPGENCPGPSHDPGQPSTPGIGQQASIDRIPSLVEYSASMGLDVCDPDGRPVLFTAVLQQNAKMVQSLIGYGADPNKPTAGEKDFCPLHAAAAMGDYDITKILLENHASPNVQERDGWTPLFFACQKGRKAVIELLFDHGADVHIQPLSNITCLMVAVTTNDESIIDLLIRRGIRADAVDDRQFTALHFCALEGFERSAIRLLQHNIDVNKKAWGGRTALHIAAEKGFCNVAEILLTAGADVSIRDESGFSPLINALMECKYDMVKLLVDKGADLNVSNELNGITSLMAAAMRGCTKVASLCLQHGCLVTAVDKDQWTALHFAIRGGSIEVVKMLLRSEADVNAVARHGKTPLLMAISHGNFQIVELLVNRGADINHQDQSGKGASHYAVLGFERNSPINMQILNFVLEKVEDVDMADRSQHTALHVAVINGRTEAARALIDFRANVEKRNHKGQTALNSVVREENALAISRVLIEEGGADVNAASTDGSTPLYRAAENGNAELVAYLCSKGASTDAKRRDSQFPLYAAVGNKHVDVVRVLLENGADVDLRRSDGVTCLIYATIHRDTEIIDLLLKRDADVNIFESRGYTPLFIACNNNCREIALQLLCRGANPNVHSQDLRSPILFGVAHDDDTLVKALLDAGASVQSDNTRQDMGLKLLFIATGNRNAGILGLLLAKGIDVNARGQQGETALLSSIFEGNEDIVRLLLVSGADPNLATHDGLSPLILAAKQSNAPVVRLLAQHGAAVDHQTNEQENALHSALTVSHSVTAEILVDYRANVDDKRHGYVPPICIAASNNAPGCAQILIDAQANLNASNAEGETALYIAASNGFAEVVRILLRAHADPNRPTKRRDTALFAATVNGHEDTVRLLLDHGANPFLCNGEKNLPLNRAVDRNHYNIAVALMGSMKELKERRECVRQRETGSTTPNTHQIQYSGDQGSSHRAGCLTPQAQALLDEDDPPPQFKCPITLDIMRDPVVAADGYSYEREEIERWIRSKGNSPITKIPMSLDRLTPNMNLRQQIEAFITRYPAFSDTCTSEPFHDSGQHTE